MIRFIASSNLSCISLAMSLRDGVDSVVDGDAAIFDKVFSVANIRVSSPPMSRPRDLTSFVTVLSCLPSEFTN